MTKKEIWEIGPEAFLLRGTSSKGALLLHGFTSSAAEMRLLGNFLHEKGYTVYAPLLPGHGTTPEDLQKKNYQDFIREALEGYRKLEEIENVREIYLAGQSMGGLLALYLAEKGYGKKLAVLAAPVWIQQSLGEWAWVLQYIKPFTERRKKPMRINGELVYRGYSKMPLSTLASMLKLRRKVIENLKKITNPMLLIYSRAEHTVKPESADYIAQNASNCMVKQVWLDRSGHAITLDNQKEIAFQEIWNFFEEKQK